ncbi:hypothetical protein N9V83_02975 [Flavobacteriales bacterium]|nr:hypothetical protein [Flavobacteriales bacterium]
MKYVSLFLLLGFFTIAQDSTSFWKDKFSYNGYVKYLNTASSFNEDWMFNQLIHNRINTRIKWSKSLSSGVEFRNRIFYGDNNSIEGVINSMKDDGGLVNTSAAWQENLGDPMLSVQIDRWWLKYEWKTWELNAGRQRINWGMNFLWNVNDVFNAYNFSDFDYEERPGTDAIVLTKYIKDLNQLDVAISPSRDFENYSVAARYRWNKNMYDFQVLSGKVQDDFFLGGGWDGSIKNIGWKGELSTFYPINEGKTFNDDLLTITGAFSVDYSWQNGWMVLGGYYFNSTFLNLDNYGTNLTLINSSAKALLPLPHAMFLQTGKSLGALWRADLILLGLPTGDAVFLMPTLSYSVSESVDLSIVDQIILGSSIPGAQSLNVRLKWSF